MIRMTTHRLGFDFSLTTVIFMKHTDDVFESLNWSLFRMLPDLFDNNGGKGARDSVVIKVLFFALLILLFVGDEVVKLLFRRNFGASGIHWWKAVLCTLAFGGCGISAFQIGFEINASEAQFYGPLSFMVAGALNVGLSCFLLYKWLILPRNRLAHKYYRGDSTALSFLLEKGWSQSRVQNFAEPLTLLCAGTLLSAINPMLGLPLMFCAVSSWLTYAMEAVTGRSDVRDALAQRGHQRFQSDDYSNVH